MLCFGLFALPLIAVTLVSSRLFARIHGGDLCPADAVYSRTIEKQVDPIWNDKENNSIWKDKGMIWIWFTLDHLPDFPMLLNSHIGLGNSSG